MVAYRTGLCLLSLAALLPAAAGEFVDRVVARSGQAAAGVPSATFDRLGTAAISGDGKIVFRATMAGGSVARGIWTETDDVIGLADYEGRSSPQGSPWFQPSDPNIADGGTVALPWRVNDPTLGLQDAFWFDPGMGLVNLVLQGEQTPLTAGVNFGTSILGLPDETILINSQEQFLFAHRLEGNVTQDDDDILLFIDSQNEQVVAREGDATAAGGVYGFNAVESPFIDFAITGDGTVVFAANLTFPDGTGGVELRRGLFRYSSGQTTVLGVELGPCPGTANCTLGPIERVAVNGAGEVAFLSQQSVGSELKQVIYRITAAGVASLIYQSDPASSLFIPCCLSPMLLYETGEAIVAGFNDGNPALIEVSNGTATVMMEVGQQAPGTPAGTVYSAFTRMHINRTGQLVFGARLSGTGVTASNRIGIWASQGNGPQQLVVRAGEDLEVSQGNSKVVQVAALLPDAGPVGGEPRSLSNEGEVLWEASFTDGTQALIESFIGLPPAPPPTVVAIEPVQVIQDWNNSVPLIENKFTYVRVHLRSEITEPVDVRLRGYDFATLTELPGSPLKPLNPGGFVIAGPDGDANRDNVWASALFALPAQENWRTGLVSLIVESDNTGLNCQEAAGTFPSDCTAEISFVTAQTPEIAIISVNWDNGEGVQTVSPELRQRMAGRIFNMYPINDLNWRSRSADWPQDGQPLVWEALQYAEYLRTQDGCSAASGCRRLYYTAVLGSGDPEGDLGQGALSGVWATGYVPKSRRAQGRQTHAHEMGHNLNRSHAVHSEFGLNENNQKKGACNAVADPAIDDFPNLFTVDGKRRPTLGPLDQGADATVWGYDIRLGQPIDPEKYFELMSYCDNTPVDFWPSRFTYEALLQSINSRFAPAQKGMAGQASDYSIIRGVVDAESGNVTLSPFAVLFGAQAPDVSPAGGWSARLLDSSSNLLDEISFEPVLAEARVGEVKESTFLLASTVVAGIARLEIVNNGAMQAAMDASDSDPVVSLQFPVGGELLESEEVTLLWSGSDPDSDPLTYVVQFSADDGQTWRTLAADWPQTAYTVPRSALNRTTSGRVRIQASDGLRTAMDVSATAFTVTNNAPQLTLLSPGDNDIVTPNQSILLRAEGYDPEDGPLDATAVSWVSDRDGSLGGGTDLQLVGDALTPGVHLVTATASDSDGGAASRQVTIEVLTGVPADLADLELRMGTTVGGPSIGSLLLEVEVLANGPTAATDLALTLTAVGSPLELLQIPTGWSCTGAGAMQTCTAAVQAPLEKSTLIARLTADLGGEVTVTGFVTGAGRDPVPGNNSGASSLQILADVILRDGFE